MPVLVTPECSPSGALVASFTSAAMSAKCKGLEKLACRGTQQGLSRAWSSQMHQSRKLQKRGFQHYHLPCPQRHHLAQLLPNFARPPPPWMMTTLPVMVTASASEGLLSANSVALLGAGKPLVVFPGGGMFFYWQIGAATALGRRFDLEAIDMSGASAGALAATLAACNVDGRVAAQAAFQLSLDNKVWDRATGLGGIWGDLIRTWLHDLLPEDAAEVCRSRLHLHVLDLPSIRRRSAGFERRAVSDFESKEDLVECCMASVHIPFFIDGRPWTRHRARRCIDGSILASRQSMNVGGVRPTLCLDYTDDEVMKSKRLQFLSLGAEGEGPSRTWAWLEEMMDRGEQHVESLYASGDLDFLANYAKGKSRKNGRT